MLLMLVPALCARHTATATMATGNKFGIGVYTDTPGSPPSAIQLDAAQKLSGARGWVTVYVCSWRSGNSSCMNRSTTALDGASRATLLAAYERDLTVVVRLGYPLAPRDHSDDSQHLHYTGLAAAYARVTATLPPPPTGRHLYVHVGNEFNACNEWRCTSVGNSSSISSTGNITSAAMAVEVAAFYRDLLAAVAPLRSNPAYTFLRYAHGPIANWQNTACACDGGAPLGSGQPGLVFLRAMQAAVPELYSKVDWFSSHAYPYSASPWGTDKATRGLTYYRSETQVIGRGAVGITAVPARARVPVPVIITETGWRRDATRGIGDAQVANWTSLAYTTMWVPDSQVLGVTPFLLAGKFWEGLGWPWVTVGGDGVLVPRQVYTDTRALRCRIEGHAC